MYSKLLSKPFNNLTSKILSTVPLPFPGSTPAVGWNSEIAEERSGERIGERWE
jgi:hypothetical protein